MDFFKSLKDKVFGCTDDVQPPQRYQPDQQDIDDYNNQQGDNFGFRVFSNPLEMHRYFERQMGEVFKSFGMTERDGPFMGGDSPFFGTHAPSIDEVPNSGSLRDQYLKPGFEKPAENYRGDRIIDGHVDVGELDSVIKPEEGGKMMPHFKGHFFGQSMSSKTVMRSDGMSEIHRTIRDSQGNKQITVTKKMGDKEYSVTTKTDSTGKKEISENIVNMDEKEVEFFKNQSPKDKNLPPITDKSDTNIFDKLFGSKM